ncbi:hypothetical protein [Mucilaginibacter psychrotolerans]|uniref:hypothetical protein n=1 Tax=Mucilaginibacter psychrotolerans TaxID=1524096 RepID=UPI00130507D9|nr:hypothetical protein [Mucilaginibacter psychrotolerans]
MSRDTKYIVIDSKNADGAGHQVKHYAESAFVAKKTQEAKETLQKFPVPEKYAK